MLRGQGGSAAQSFVGSEEKSRGRQGSTERGSLLALPKDAARQARHFEEAPGIGRFIAEKLECIAVKMLAARLGHDVDYSAARLLKLRGSECRLDAELFHGFHQRHHGNTVDIGVGVV